MTARTLAPRWGTSRPVIWLTGLMATGKSTAGRTLATLLGRPFADTDSLVEAAAGCSVADVFAAQGEAAFRALERAAVQDAAARPGAVVALGGGAWLDAANRRTIQAAGPVVWLTARPETIADRLGPAAVASRPLLQGGDVSGTIARLLAEREPVYRTADHAVATDGLSPEAVAAAIRRWLEAQTWWS